MNELQMISRQQPGMVAIDNLAELKNALAVILARYDNIVYSESMLADAKADKKELSRLRKQIDDRRKDIKRAYLEPYNEFESRVKELLAMIDEPLDRIKGFVDDMDQREKDAKRAEIEGYFWKKAVALGNMAQQVWDSPAFFNEKWLNKTTSTKAWQDELDEKIAVSAKDLQSILLTGGANAEALTARYLEDLSMDSLVSYRERIADVRFTADATVTPQAGADARTGYKVLKLTGTSEQMAQILDIIALAGIECEELEDGMPQQMPERTEPDFDSFVAFDIETTGTYGAANGDIPAEITEIGAVKVVNGQIVERFSELVNPGRKILPHIARITHITDDMVADKQGIEVIIKAFAEFVGDSILVGHNIRSSDLHYIDRAAKRAGVRIENGFFDTYLFAKKMKEKHGWEKVTLEYLSDRFGIEQPDAHRAWCDAEANVGLYFKLKELENCHG